MHTEILDARGFSNVYEINVVFIPFEGATNILMDASVSTFNIYRDESDLRQKRQKSNWDRRANSAP